MRVQDAFEITQKLNTMMQVRFYTWILYRPFLHWKHRIIQTVHWFQSTRTFFKVFYGKRKGFGYHDRQDVWRKNEFETILFVFTSAVQGMYASRGTFFFNLFSQLYYIQEAPLLRRATSCSSQQNYAMDVKQYWIVVIGVRYARIILSFQWVFMRMYLWKRVESGDANRVRSHTAEKTDHWIRRKLRYLKSKPHFATIA